jgi:4-hydroxyphenylacetate 3-monooxygenase
VISGAQQVATGGVFSDYVQLSSIHPLVPGDENYANCVAIPICAPGVKLFSRRPFATRADNSFDYPLSSRFDESDSYVVFDNVFVPWEHVFIYRNIELTRDQWFKTPSHIYGNHQAQVRYVTKLRFMMGLAQRMTEMIGTAGLPPTQIAMGELAAFATIYESMLLAHEINAPIINGVLWPSRATLYGAMAMQAEFNGRMLEMIRELVSSSVISLPSSVTDFDNPEIAPFIERYMRSGSMDARSRTALVRLLWDFVGTEFGSRHQQYEKFYGGSSFVVKQNVYRNYDFKRATAMVDRALALPPVED